MYQKWPKLWPSLGIRSKQKLVHSDISKSDGRKVNGDPRAELRFMLKGARSFALYMKQNPSPSRLVWRKMFGAPLVALRSRNEVLSLFRKICHSSFGANSGRYRLLFPNRHHLPTFFSSKTFTKIISTLPFFRKRRKTPNQRKTASLPTT